MGRPGFLLPQIGTEIERHIIENLRTDLMADEASRTGRGTFFFNMTVPRAVGLTGNFVGIDGIR